MHRIGTFVFVVLFTSTLPAGAQSIRESAERLARRSASVQPGAPLTLRGRSMVRTWAGVGLVAGGLAMMFTGQDDCVATGSLATIEPYRVRLGSLFGQERGEIVSLTGSNLRAVRESTDAAGDPGCVYRFDVSGTEQSYYGVRLDPPETVNIVVAVQEGRSVSETYGNFLDGGLARLAGDAGVDSVRPKFRLWGGAALVAGGALLATVWADAPVDVSGDMRQVRVSRTIGW